MWLALTVSLLAAAVTVAGILAVRVRERWVLAHRAMLTSLAAGILLTISFLHLIPDAFAEGGGMRTGAGLLAGFLLLYLTSRLVLAARGRDVGPERTLGVLSLVAVGSHSLIDGVIFSIGFSKDAATGFIIAPGMILHEFVEGVLIYKLLLLGDFSRRHSLWLAIAAAALTTPLGVLLSWPLIVQLQSQIAALLTGLAAGFLIYVGGSHLLPQSEERSGGQAAGFLSGVTVGVLIVLLKHA